MLAVGIHDQGMRKALTRGCLEPMQNRGALALVPWKAKDAETVIRVGELDQRLGSAVRAAIHDNPNRIPDCSRVSYGLKKPWAGVVAWNENEMRG
jgi:hypothetical protein